jgi:hypothetical protein
LFAQESISRILSVLFVIVFMLAVTPLRSAHAAGVRYAKPAASGAGDCSSWANACTLQTALTGAVSGDEIWTAAEPQAHDRSSQSNALPTRRCALGSFAGTETIATSAPLRSMSPSWRRHYNKPARRDHYRRRYADPGIPSSSYTSSPVPPAQPDSLTITLLYCSTPPSVQQCRCRDLQLVSSLTLIDANLPNGNWAYYGAGCSTRPAVALANVIFNGNWALCGGLGCRNTSLDHPS